MSFPAGSNIQLQEKAKRRRNAGRGRRCAKGTIPENYNLAKAPIQEEGTWFDTLRARLKALWQKLPWANSQH